MFKAIFLDRDGVLNKAIVTSGKPHPPANLTELEILSGVEEAIKIFKNADYKLIVITNQPDVSRGITTKRIVDEINRDLGLKLGIDEFITCFHDDSDQCNCRKPKPGGIINAAIKHNVDLAKSYMIGDRWRDIQAGRSAGCRTIFIDYGYDEKQPCDHDFRVTSLLEAARIVVE